MFYFLMLLLVAVLVGSVTRLCSKYFPGGFAGACSVALAGGWLGAWLFPEEGPQIWQFPVVPSLIAASLFTFIMVLLAKLTHKTY